MAADQAEAQNVIVPSPWALGSSEAVHGPAGIVFAPDEQLAGLKAKAEQAACAGKHHEGEVVAHMQTASVCTLGRIVGGALRWEDKPLQGISRVSDYSVSRDCLVLWGENLLYDLGDWRLETQCASVWQRSHDNTLKLLTVSLGCPADGGNGSDSEMEDDFSACEWDMLELDCLPDLPEDGSDIILEVSCFGHHPSVFRLPAMALLPHKMLSERASDLDQTVAAIIQCTPAQFTAFRTEFWNVLRARIWSVQQQRHCTGEAVASIADDPIHARDGAEPQGGDPKRVIAGSNSSAAAGCTDTMSRL